METTKSLGQIYHAAAYPNEEWNKCPTMMKEYVERGANAVRDAVLKQLSERLDSVNIPTDDTFGPSKCCGKFDLEERIEWLCEQKSTLEKEVERLNRELAVSIQSKNSWVIASRDHFKEIEEYKSSRLTAEKKAEAMAEELEELRAFKADIDADGAVPASRIAMMDQQLTEANEQVSTWAFRHTHSLIDIELANAARLKAEEDRDEKQKSLERMEQDLSKSNNLFQKFARAAIKHQHISEALMKARLELFEALLGDGYTPDVAFNTASRLDRL